MDNKKNPLDYGYIGDEKIEITPEEFALFKSAIEHGINATLVTSLPEVKKYINTETGKEVKKPTDNDIQTGKVRPITDREATFSADNVRISYSEKLTYDMIRAQETIMLIHERNVENGVAKSSEDLKKASELTQIK